MSDAHPTSLSAVTLAVTDMAASVAFYEALGLRRADGGPDAAFTSYAVGEGFVNLQAVDDGAAPTPGWGRVILHVTDVDAVFARARAAGLTADGVPADAPWGERYVHLIDPDGHEVSIARPLDRDG